MVLSSLLLLLLLLLFLLLLFQLLFITITTDANKLAGKYKANYLSKIKICNYDDNNNDISINLDDFGDNDSDKNIDVNDDYNYKNLYNDDEPSISKLKASIGIKKMEFSMQATYKGIIIIIIIIILVVIILLISI
jgi:hypothetical protein